MATVTNMSAAVTRILSLTGFPKELKTKDIHTAFSEWENTAGGFKIKWIDDTSLYIVFQDATIAKRAYLRTIAFPPASFLSASTGESATIRPYDGPDAQSVIQAINQRQNTSRRSASISVPGLRGGGPGVGLPVGAIPGGRPGHGSTMSMSIGMGGGGLPMPAPINMPQAQPPSPSLPDLPSHPTLDSLIDASLASQAQQATRGPNHIGDPGKRMIGHALGVRHPGLQPSRSGEALAASMREMSIAE